ncbi:MAG: hypothetical protein ACI398_09840 [Clostridium sp.]
MRKYFNKGLIYEWFNSAKMIISMGIIVWGMFIHATIEGRINRASEIIASNYYNDYATYPVTYYGILGVIFALIHFSSQGINKTNNNLFLTSSPYTKKQIKYNEFICLIGTLMVFILVMVYMSIMSYIRNYELMSIIDGYFEGLGIEVIKMILLGITGILILMIIDSMFSNTIMGIICMMTVLPAAFFFIMLKLTLILEYLPGGKGYVNAFERIENLIGIDIFHNGLYLIDELSTKSIDKKQLIIECIIVIILAVVLLGVYYIIQKKYKVESNTKMFTSRLNEKIIVIITSIGIGAAVAAKFVTRYIERLTGMEYRALLGMDLVKGFGLDLSVLVVAAFISYKLINKAIKSIEQ